ncbi:hypothetical protein NXW84_18010 [Bacteroides fragilis]|nr:hypothetical protein NXW84_18010 [Bacteroides fragilis]
MKKNRLFGLLLFLLVTNNMCAQLGKAVREILTGDSVATGPQSGTIRIPYGWQI